MDIGCLRHIVTLQALSEPVPDGDGGYLPQTPTTFAGRIPAEVMPATARSLERVIANSVQSQASHLVRIRYRRGVTTKLRLIYHDGSTDRPMSVAGVFDEEERHISLVLACTEAVA